MPIPHTQPTKTVDRARHAHTGRFISLIQADDGNAADIGLVGVPCDMGVKHGGGRPGAALGPEALREALAGYGTTYNAERDLDLAALRILDFGDLICDGNPLETIHERLSEAVKAIVQRGAIPLVFGGSHDLSFAGVRGLAEAFPQDTFGGLTLDAHFDVREIVDGKITSGTPFRNILEKLEGIEGSRFTEIGINGLVNAQEHMDYLSSKGARIFFLEEVNRLGIAKVMTQGLKIAAYQSDRSFCSIDLDAVAQAYAPGVSAPSPEGLTPEDAGLAAYFAGTDEKTAYFDLMELNPHFDIDGRTARLAASLVLHFVSGVAQRKATPKPPIGFRKAHQ